MMTWVDSIEKLVIRRYYWPGLLNGLKKYVKSCSQCQLARSRGGAPKPSMKPTPPVALPFERLGIDFLSTLPLTKNGNRHCITCVDYSTRWVWSVAVPLLDEKTVIWFLYHYIITFVGAPFELFSDRGSNFMSAGVTSFLNQHQIKHLKTSPHQWND